MEKKKKKKETKEKDLLNREEKKSAEGYELSFSPFHGRISAVTLFHELAVPSARQPEERKVGRGGEKKENFFSRLEIGRRKLPLERVATSRHHVRNDESRSNWDEMGFATLMILRTFSLINLREV